MAHLTMIITEAHPKTSLTAGINDSEIAAKMIMFHALIILIKNIPCFIKNHVRTQNVNNKSCQSIGIGLRRAFQWKLCPFVFDSLCGPNAYIPILILLKRLVKNGRFQYVLLIAYKMVAKLISANSTIISHWSHLLIDIMKAM